MQRRVRRYAARLTGAAIFLACCLCGPGCEDGDSHDHVPPAGQGSLFLVNDTASKITVFVDGSRACDVDHGDEQALDLEPGLYRVVLNSDDSDRSFGGDVDILENRLTVLDVSDDTSSPYAYDVITTYE